MPYINDTAPRGCERCDYYQKATHWCLRYNCVQDNMARAQKWKEERAAQISAAMAHIDHRGESWLEMDRKRKERMAAMFEARMQNKQKRDERRRRLYDLKLPDETIARLEGVSASAIRHWRFDMGLPMIAPKKPAGLPPVPPAEHARRLEAYNSTSSDGEAARMLCMSLNTFRYWRQGAGLKSKYERHAKHGTRLTPAEHARRVAAYNATTSDSKAGALVGLSSKAFCKWRNLAGLPSKA